MRPATPQAPLYAPQLHRNALLAALQLLGWLFLRPSAWRQHLQRFAPDLPSDFTLLTLRGRHWRQAGVRRLLVLIYLLWPLLVALLTAALLWSAGRAGDAILQGALAGFALGLLSGLLMGLFLSVAASLSGVLCGGLALGLLVGLFGLPVGSTFVATEHLRPLSLPNMAADQAVIQNDASAISIPLTATPQPPALQMAVAPTTMPVEVAAVAPAQAEQVVGIVVAPPIAPGAAEPTTTPAIAAEAAVGAMPAADSMTMSLPVTEVSAISATVVTLTTASSSGPVNIAGISPLPTPFGSGPIDNSANTPQLLAHRNENSLPAASQLFTSSIFAPMAPGAITTSSNDNNSGLIGSAQADSRYSIDSSSVTPTLAVSTPPPPASPNPSNQRGDMMLRLVSAFGLLLIGMIVGVAATIAGSSAIERAHGPAPPTWRQQIGGMAVGLLVSSALWVLSFGATHWVRQLLLRLVYGWATVDWHGVLLLVLLVGVGVTLLLALPYRLTKRLAGPWAGGIAGALGGVGALTLLLLALTGQPLWPHWPLSLLCLALGLALPLWWPLLHYPFVAAWSSLLFRLEERRAADHALLLPYHPAFWDELQPLPLPALDDYLVLAVERKGAQGKAALTFLSQGRQRWAAQAAQIELDARRLAACETVADIPVACRQVVAGELSNAASALLRTFHRIGADVEAALAQEGLYNQRLALTAVEERLDSLLRELTRSNERYAVRFLAIAEIWWELVHDAIARLTTIAEQRQEIESPYVIGVPLTAQQEIFVGRADICERIEQLLRDQRHPPLLLYGQRRMGKTSLLNNLGRLLPSTIVPLFVDLQGPVALAGDHAGFLYNLARTMSESARRQRDLTFPPLLRTELADDPFTRFDEWLDEVEQVLGDCTALLALDEFEVLDSAFAAGRLQAEAVLGSLRHWVQHRPRFKILLTGSHVVEELSSWANYLINVQVVHIGFLSETETRRLVEQPVKGFALRYEAAATQRVWELTHGHPALTQLLCYEIVAFKNQQPPESRRLATVADVEAAAITALEHGALFFHEIETGQLTTAARIVLQWLAGQGEGAIVAVERVQATWPDEVSPAVKLLLRRELIEYTKGGYCFQVELIRRWFAQGHS
ncbi:MAG: hypothetical protein DYG89_20230 [Caldilinea sp. CFX5]|nr:hypothetical protein [Caldilinea sp. CFX5]